jgi:hypothetical protein
MASRGRVRDVVTSPSTNMVERTTIGEFAPGPRGPHQHADTDGDWIRQYAGRRLPQEAPADASRNEDGSKREVV